MTWARRGPKDLFDRMARSLHRAATGRDVEPPAVARPSVATTPAESLSHAMPGRAEAPSPRAAAGDATPSAASPGHGHSHGAITILNATATGIGCSLAVDLGLEAVWARRPVQAGTEVATGSGQAGRSFEVDGAPDDRVVRAVANLIDPACGAKVSIRCDVPPSRGLKTSSMAAGALVEACRRARGEQPQPLAVAREAVLASRDAGVTLTGAFDDQCAVTMGGCHLTDNGAQRVLASVAVQPWWVALWVPEAMITKGEAARAYTAGIRDEVAPLAELVRQGRIGEALTRNGRAFTRAYLEAGLPVSARPSEVALQAGALGAGLSGTGPAVAALFARRVALPEVAGGVWRWCRPVPGQSVTWAREGNLGGMAGAPS